MQELLDSKKINELLETMAEKIYNEFSSTDSVALVGIRSRGEILAQRLNQLLQNKGLSQLDSGVLDITLYRDDLDLKGADQPQVRSTEIEFDINEYHIILIDDVIWTGRTIRAALDALMDIGRPKVVRLAILVDKGFREFPIHPDYIGQEIDVSVDQKVRVYLNETDDKEQVVVE